MNKVVRLRLTPKVVGEAPSYALTVTLVGCIVGVAFALPLRIVWCRIQPLLVIALLLVGTFLRRSRISRPAPISVSRDKLSTYDALIRNNGSGAARWDEALFVYAAWIAYGSLFHEAKHAAADLSLFDDTWISSAFFISTLRAVLFTAGTCFSYSEAFAERTPRFWLAFFSYSMLLLALPPLNGVPHTLSVSATIARAFAFLWFFGVNEFMRSVLEHWNFAKLVAEDGVDASTVLRLEESAVVCARPAGDKLPLLTLHACRNQPLAVTYVAENSAAIPVPWSVLRSAWLLTLSNAWITYVCALVCFGFLAYSTRSWSLNAEQLLHKDTTKASPQAVPQEASVEVVVVGTHQQQQQQQQHARKRRTGPPTPPPVQLEPAAPPKSLTPAQAKKTMTMIHERIGARKVHAPSAPRRDQKDIFKTLMASNNTFQSRVQNERNGSSSNGSGVQQH